MKKLKVLVVFASIIFGASLLPPTKAAQKDRRSTALSRKTAAPQPGNAGQFKEAFQTDAGKVRLVALLSPT